MHIVLLLTLLAPLRLLLLLLHSSGLGGRGEVHRRALPLAPCKLAHECTASCRASWHTSVQHTRTKATASLAQHGKVQRTGALELCDKRMVHEDSEALTPGLQKLNRKLEPEHCCSLGSKKNNSRLAAEVPNHLIGKNI